MVDRGFTIDDLLFPLHVKLNIPAFTKNKPQLSDKEDCQGAHSCGKGLSETQSVQDVKWYCACGIFKTV